MVSRHASAIWQYRNFVLSAIRFEIKGRFASSKFGFFWLILHPLAQVAVFALVLAKVLGAKLPGIECDWAYVAYLLAGILAWSLFSEDVTRCTTAFVDNANYLKKVVFPRICLPVIISGSALINNVLLLVAMIAILHFIGFHPTGMFIWLPVLIVLNLAFAVGLGILLGVLNVFIRDVNQVLQIVLQFWFWLTPIVYSIQILPEGFGRFLGWNPLYLLVTAYHDALIYGVTPDINALAKFAAMSLALGAVGLLLFRRASPEMVDVL